MASHGSRKFKQNQVHYLPQDLKAIKIVWEDTFGGEFRPDPKIQLQEMIQEKLGRDAYDAATIRSHDISRLGHGREIHYTSKQGRTTEINWRRIGPLVILALHNSNGEYTTQGSKVYIPPRR